VRRTTKGQEKAIISFIFLPFKSFFAIFDTGIRRLAHKKGFLREIGRRVCRPNLTKVLTCLIKV
jgi:hypothetical protein